MRDVLLVEAPDGFIVQGLVISGGQRRHLVATRWARSVKETLTFLDDDIARFMEEAAARRGRVAAAADRTTAGHYETAFRVIGRYIDEQKPQRRLLLRAGRRLRRPPAAWPARPGSHHELAEFTKDDIAGLVAKGPSLRHPRERPGAGRPRRRPNHASTGGRAMKALKTVAVALGITLAALIVIPLAVLAGLFVWLKLTEEDDEEILELDSEGA